MMFALLAACEGSPPDGDETCTPCSDSVEVRFEGNLLEGSARVVELAPEGGDPVSCTVEMWDTGLNGACDGEDLQLVDGGFVVVVSGSPAQIAAVVTDSEPPVGTDGILVDETFPITYESVEDDCGDTCSVGALSIAL